MPTPGMPDPDRVVSIWRTLESWALMLSRRWAGGGELAIGLGTDAVGGGPGLGDHRGRPLLRVGEHPGHAGLGLAPGALHRRLGVAVAGRHRVELGLRRGLLGLELRRRPLPALGQGGLEVRRRLGGLGALRPRRAPRPRPGGPRSHARPRRARSRRPCERRRPAGRPRRRRRGGSPRRTCRRPRAGHPPPPRRPCAAPRPRPTTRSRMSAASASASERIWPTRSPRWSYVESSGSCASRETSASREEEASLRACSTSPSATASRCCSSAASFLASSSARSTSVGS